MDFHHSFESDRIAGVIGAGSFGTALSNIIAENYPVLLYARRETVVEHLTKTRAYKGVELHPNIRITNDIEELIATCELIFPVVPSESFREMMRDIAHFLHPYHKLIHATKGLDVDLPEGETLHTIDTLKREDVHTMSDVITSESVVMRVGCVAGPNLAPEIMLKQPAATVVASRFEEVIREGSAALRTSRFRVHGNHDLFGIELAGVLKNIMAIASGILGGLSYGENTRALLITRGIAEIIKLGTGLGADTKAFLGLAGVGDLVATCYSPLSRNYTLGYRLAKGEELDEIIDSMEEVAEGVKTICVARALAMQYKIPAPITQALYRILFEGMDIQKGMTLLMEYPFREDVEFL